MATPERNCNGGLGLSYRVVHDIQLNVVPGSMCIDDHRKIRSSSHLTVGLSLKASYKVHSDCTALKSPTGTGSDTLVSLKASTPSTYLANKVLWNVKCSSSCSNLCTTDTNHRIGFVVALRLSATCYFVDETVFQCVFVAFYRTALFVCNLLFL